MKNQIIYIEKHQKDAVIQEYQARNYYIAKLDGSRINTLVDYMNAIIVAFQFPDEMFKNTDNIDSYNDWMRDFWWIEEYDGYVLIIENFEQMMKNDLDNKETILKGFDKAILPFWEEEVLHVVVEGKTKGFLVFIIE